MRAWRPWRKCSRVLGPVAGGRHRGFSVDQQPPERVATLMKSMFFDTCADPLPCTRRLTEGVLVDNIPFATEMLGAMRGIDAHTGHHFDDAKH